MNSSSMDKNNDQLSSAQVEQGGVTPQGIHQVFKCNQCAAKLTYKPGTEFQLCEYCGHENPIPQSEKDIQELDFQTYLTELSNKAESEERLTIKCQACAAETTFEPNITSQACPFCGTNIVSTAQSTKHLKPRSLLPFKVNKDEARSAFKNWVAKLWFAPNDIKRMAEQDQKLVGMYVPYWTFDADTVSFYTGQRGEHYWVTESYTVTVNGRSERRTRQVRKTRWYSASGTVWKNFDDVLVLASTSLPRKYTERLEPWDLKNLKSYKDAYLSGFRCESYNINLVKGFGLGKEIMDQQIRLLVRRDIGGDEQRIFHVNTQHDNVTFKHILLPVWISAYRYGNKIFRFLINARTGEVQGERPWSWIKISLLCIFIIGLVWVISFYYNQGY